MKIRKKTAIIASLVIGSLIFIITAVTEVASKSAYEQGKDTLKYTAENLTSKFSSYTVDMSVILKDNDNVIFSQDSVNKYDISKNASESVTTTVDGSNKTERYYYRDKNTLVTNNRKEDTYYVTEYTSPLEYKFMTNPFKEKNAEDIEKIADALIGNLKDNVVVSEKTDGSKELSGSIREAQIPALVNAVASFQFKNSFGMNENTDNQNKMPKITKDIFVKEVKGKMVVDKNGIIQSVFGTAMLSGKDDDGKDHNITFELLGKISDIDSTKVTKKDLSGKKVVKSVQRDYNNLQNLQMYVGTYKSNVVIEKGGKFEKIGERILDIAHADNKNIAGRYHEQYKQGYEEYAKDAKDFRFDAEFNESTHNGNFNYTDALGNGGQGNLSFDLYSGKIYFNFDNGIRSNLMTDNEFIRVFD
ncbi:hypothetical protein CPJCM30710_15340 [Clostridium polyendosporum]|uniref:Uncharacterized protein n=1 Tax=Clostridium polyendosporum TaxID=69208 RepID=A0A919S1G6_9CLOT|nr:hypothetical protein [Clostridium polyendosporum]GIM28868.1 hypothetical protein CPJCM30710_15340 [Clostridium polyendosporum]